jgi:hypothetical protein
MHKDKYVEQSRESRFDNCVEFVRDLVLVFGTQACHLVFTSVLLSYAQRRQDVFPFKTSKVRFNEYLHEDQSNVRYSEPNAA